MHEAIREELSGINRRLDRIERLLQIIAHEGADIMTTQADIDAKFAATNAKLTAMTSADQGVITLLGSVAQQVKDLTAQLQAANPALDLSAFDALGASLDKNAADAAAAVVANTPAAPTPTP